MADRELLDLAAKAYGITVEHISGKLWVCGELYEEWNPLTDDGQALRIAVKLGIQFHLEGKDDDEMVWANEVSAHTNGDAFDATRRAIVRAAAEIGRSL